MTKYFNLKINLIQMVWRWVILINTESKLKRNLKVNFIKQGYTINGHMIKMDTYQK